MGDILYFPCPQSSSSAPVKYVRHVESPGGVPVSGGNSKGQAFHREKVKRKIVKLRG
jgi:hypothetical protein